MNDPRRTVSVIHTALLSAQVVFGVVALAIERSVPPSDVVAAETLLIICVLVALGGMTGSFFVGRALLDKAASLATEPERIAAALRGFVARSAILEGTSLACIVFYLVTGELVFYAVFAVVLMMFIFRRPTGDEWDRVVRGR